MKTFLSVVAVLILLSSPAWAATKTLILTVSNMTCATCPITVKKALTKVPGVSAAKVDFGTKHALVTFDDTKTNAAALIKATTDAGYPSVIKESTK